MPTAAVVGAEPLDDVHGREDPARSFPPRGSHPRTTGTGVTSGHEPLPLDPFDLNAEQQTACRE